MTYRIAVLKRGSILQLVDADRKVIFKQINNLVAEQLQAMALHEVDLIFCRSCLSELDTLDYAKQSERAEAFWISCITRFFKCFGKSKARSKLSATKIFNNAESAEIFKFFRALRNKHIVHDENPFSDALVAIAINASEQGEPVIEVFASPIHLFLIGGAEIERLRLLVDTTFEWVTSRRIELEKKLTSEYSQWTRDRLLALPDLKVSPPNSSDVFVKRVRLMPVDDS